MSDKKNILIDLKTSTYPNINHEINNLIQQEAIEKLNNLFDQILDNAKNYDPSKNDESNEHTHFRRRHEAIALLGERGTGKTNFLVNLNTIFSDKHKKSIKILKVLDPTLFEARQNILVVIITLIKQAIKKNKENFQEHELYQAWAKYLERLAQGLNLIDENIGNNPMKRDLWDDPFLIMEKGLDSSLSGYSFEKNLHCFLFYSTKLLNISSIVVRFDDIDTNPEKGWNVLEVIRKYLTTPHLQVIISGDWKLYSKIVRIAQWKHLKTLQKHEQNANISETIDDLEEQYLSKILQPDFRIYLRTIRHITYHTKIGQRLIVQGSNIKAMFEEEMTIKDIYTYIFKNLFNMGDNMLDSSCTLLMNLPVRNNIYILRAFDSSLEKNKTLNVEAFMGKFTNIFLTLLDRFDFSFRDFQRLSEPSGYSFLGRKILNLTQKDKNINFRSIISTHTNFMDESINLFVLFVHGFTVQSMNESVSLIFDWYYRINLLGKVQLQYKDEFNSVLEYMDFNKRVSTYKVAIKYTGLLDYSDQIGYAEIYRNKKYVAHHSSMDILEDRIFEDEYYSNIEETNQFIGLLLSVVTKNVLQKKEKETHSYISFNYLAGFLSNILGANTSKKLLKKMSYINTLKEYSLTNRSSRISYGEKLFNDNQTYKELDNLIKELDVWITSKEKLKDFTLQQIDDLWETFEDREHDISYVTSAGEYLETQIYIFLDALLRTSDKAEATTFKVVKSVSTAQKYFQENLNTYYNKDNKHKRSSMSIKERLNLIEKQDELNLCEFFMLCPLWNYYIDYTQKIDIYSTKNKDKLIIFEDLGKESTYHTFFRDIGIYSNKKASETLNLFDRSVNKTDEEIIQDEYISIDDKTPKKLFDSIKSLVKSAKYPGERISKTRVDQWIKMYERIKEEKDKQSDS